jgi:hypothetical protein
METRIKYIKKNTAGEGYYAVQVKKWIFWKTIYTDGIFDNIEKFIDTLSKIDEINNKTKSLNKIVCKGYAVRNVYKGTGMAHAIKFFESYPSKHERNDKSEMIWADANGCTVSTMEINTEKLFGKECLEPMKLRITIEQIEE